MKILVSNDDGVNARGIKILASRLAEFASVIVVAPDRNRSGASNALTLQDPLRVTQLDNGFYSVQGTPTDCVHLALTGLLDERPDMVISGINAGSNTGEDVLYSGTVAAATEGAMLGYPAIAVSSTARHPKHYDAAAHWVCELVKQLKKNPLPKRMLWNLNVPDKPLEALSGIKVVRTGSRHMAEPMIQRTDPRGGEIFWVGLPGPEKDAGPDTDFGALNEGYIALTPLHVDLTDHQDLERLRGWLPPNMQPHEAT